MVEQRLSGDRSSSVLSRRAVLRGGAVAAGGLLAGCTGTSLSGMSLSSGRDAVSMLAAGSLANALEHGLRPAVEAPLRVEARGSVAAARMVAGGQKDPHIVSLADTVLFDSLLAAEWYAEFATNAVVIAYDPDSAGGESLAAAGTDGWYRPILAGDVSLGRTDPDLDPLGYRTLFALELASRHYGLPDLRERIAARARVYPEAQLISGFETGSIDAAVAYRNMAVERGYEFVDLPPRIDLSDPAYADEYATASYTLPDGGTVRGGVISYGSTIRRADGAAVDAFRSHVAGDYLTDFGFGVPDDYPRYTGDVPDDVAV